MRKIIPLFFAFFASILIGVSCSSDSDNMEEFENGQNDGSVEVELPSETDDELDGNEQDLSELSNAVYITFSSITDAQVSNLNNVSSSINGNHVTITSSAAAGINYVLTGVTNNGSITFTSENKFNLYLNGVGISNPSGAAIKSTQKAVSVIVQDNTNNRLVDSSISEDKAAFYSKGKMNFGGNGNLEVRGKAKHGISSGNEIVINSSTIYIKEAASDAIHGDGITITDGNNHRLCYGRRIGCRRCGVY